MPRWFVSVYPVYSLRECLSTEGSFTCRTESWENGWCAFLEETRGAYYSLVFNTSDFKTTGPGFNPQTREWCLYPYVTPWILSVHTLSFDKDNWLGREFRVFHQIQVKGSWSLVPVHARWRTIHDEVAWLVFLCLLQNLCWFCCSCNIIIKWNSLTTILNCHVNNN